MKLIILFYILVDMNISHKDETRLVCIGIIFGFRINSIHSNMTRLTDPNMGGGCYKFSVEGL